MLGLCGEIAPPLSPVSFSNPYSAILHLRSSSRYALSSLFGDPSTGLVDARAGQRYETPCGMFVAFASLTPAPSSSPHAEGRLPPVVGVANMRTMSFHVSELRLGRSPSGRGWLIGQELVLGRLYTSPGRGWRRGLLLWVGRSSPKRCAVRFAVSGMLAIAGRCDAFIVHECLLFYLYACLVDTVTFMLGASKL